MKMRLTTRSKQLRAFTLVGRSRLRLRGGCGWFCRVEAIDLPLRRARQVVRVDAQRDRRVRGAPAARSGR